MGVMAIADNDDVVSIGGANGLTGQLLPRCQKNLPSHVVYSVCMSSL